MKKDGIPPVSNFRLTGAKIGASLSLMKTPLGIKTCLMPILALCFIPMAHAADKSPVTYRLTVELRDGSRVIGKSLQNNFDFHSAILGDVELPLSKVRVVESLSSGNDVKVTSANNDILTVEFATKEIKLETSFGEVKLPPAMIRSIHISGGPGRPTDGLIAHWSGEDNGDDSINGHSGNLINVTFTEGVVGRAFTFSPNGYPWGTYTGLQIPDDAAFELTREFTIEGWVRPRGDGYIILCRGDHRPGLDPYTLSMEGNHDLQFAISDEANNNSHVDTTLPYCQWTHVAAVFDGAAKTISLYTNGVLAAQSHTDLIPIGKLIPEQTPGLGIGNLNDGGNNFPFAGDIDEISLYGRALSADEINAIYSENAGNATGRAEPLPTRNESFRYQPRMKLN